MSDEKERQEGRRSASAPSSSSRHGLRMAMPKLQLDKSQADDRVSRRPGSLFASRAEERMRNGGGGRRNLPANVKTSPRGPSEHERRIVKGEGRHTLDIVFPFDKELVESVKALPGRRWDPSRRCWTLHLSPVLDTRSFWVWIMEHGFHVEDNARAEMAEWAEHQGLMESYSNAVEAVGEKLSPVPEGMKLHSYQVAGIRALVRAKRCFLADEVGLGKTVQAIKAVEELDRFPCLIVAPASLLINWQREIAKWTGDDSVIVQGSKTPVPRRTKWVITTWGTLRMQTKGFIHLLKQKPSSIIADEFHRAKNLQAQQTKALLDIVKQSSVDVCFGLTATPMPSRPYELIAQLKVLGLLEHMGGSEHFIERHCLGEFNPHTGFRDKKGANNLDELHANLRRVGFVRRRKRDVLPQLPEKQIVEIPVPVGARYMQEFRRIIGKLADTDMSKATGMSAGVGLMNQLKKASAMAKMPHIHEWIKDFFDGGGKKLLIFGFHHDTVAKVVEKYSTDCVKVTGKMSKTQRQAAVDAFQNDDSCKILMGTFGAAGEGLTLTAAYDVLFVEPGWTPKDYEQCEGRAYGRLNDLHGITSWNFIGEETIDEEIMDVIKTKARAISQAIDGEAFAAREVAKRLVEKWKQINA